MTGSSTIKTAQMGASPKMPSSADHGSEILHQTRKSPYCRGKMALAGFAVALGLGYVTLYSKKKPEASALDVAKVATGTADPEHTKPRN